MDKRLFHNYLNQMKDENPDAFGLIESIQGEFESTFESISDDERKALRNLPIQFIERVPQEDGGWTTNLHIWAENGVEDVLDLDPMILAHKNGYGDTVLMALVVGATGAHTEVINYKLIQKILETELDYEDIERVDGNDVITPVNALDILDLNGQSVLDYLLDFAYATGPYEGQLPDEKLQMLLKYFAEYYEDVEEEEQPEKIVIVHDEPTEKPELEDDTEDESDTPNDEDEKNDSLDIKNYVSDSNSSSTNVSTMS